MTRGDFTIMRKRPRATEAEKQCQRWKMLCHWPEAGGQGQKLSAYITYG